MNHLALMTLLADAEPWFSNEAAIYFGSFGGAAIGILGGILGAAVGVLAPKGKGRRFVMNSMLAFGCVGIVFLLTGVVALVMDQPYAIYYLFLLLGLILTSVMFAIRPAIRQRYAEAEQRKVEAAALRRG
jgi:MFS family permease